ncbi:MAG TPA: hypothetical protein DCY20_10585, partial [Firmicutes bacterium]|nr:hypothetical protein [Bacillota bacterium]
MQIRNICRINYQHAATDDEPLIHEVVYSNQVQTTMIDKRIKAFKIVDKDQALFFEQLTYTIEIQNISNHDIPYCYFKDELA